MPDQSQPGPSSTHTTAPTYDSRSNKRNRTRRKKTVLPLTAGQSSATALQTGGGSGSGLAGTEGVSAGPSNIGGMRAIWSTEPNRVSSLQSDEVPGAFPMDSSDTSAQSCVSTSNCRATKRRRMEEPDDEQVKDDVEVNGVKIETTDNKGNTINSEEANEPLEAKGEVKPQKGKGKSRSLKSRSLEDINRSSRYFGKPLPQAPIPEPSTSTIPIITNHTLTTDLAAYRSAQKFKETELLAEREREQAAQVIKEEEEKEKAKMKGELKLAKGEIAFKNSTIIAQNGTIDAVKQAVTCNVCLEMFVNPHVLAPCGHTACAPCLLAWFKSPNCLLHPLGLNEDYRPDDHHATRTKCCFTCRTPVSAKPIPNYTTKHLLDAIRGQLDIEAVEDPSVPNGSIVEPVGDIWEGVFKDKGPSKWYFDEQDRVRRCRDCGGEVEGGECFNCGEQFSDIISEEGSMDMGLDGSDDNVEVWHGGFPGFISDEASVDGSDAASAVSDIRRSYRNRGYQSPIRALRNRVRWVGRSEDGSGDDDDDLRASGGSADEDFDGPVPADLDLDELYAESDYGGSFIDDGYEEGAGDEALLPESSDEEGGAFRVMGTVLSPPRVVSAGSTANAGPSAEPRRLVNPFRRIGSPAYSVSDDENEDNGSAPAIIRRSRRARLDISSDGSDSDERRDQAFRASRSRAHRVAPVVLTDDDEDD